MPISIYDYFLAAAEKYANRAALMHKKNGKYQKITYQEFKTSVDTLAAQLIKLGIKKGDTVAIYSYNRPEWAITDLAILKIGAVVVPIYHVLSPFYVKYILNDCRAKLVFIENKSLYEPFATIHNELTSLEKIVLFDDTEIQSGTDYLRFSDLINAPGLDNNKFNVSGNDIATIVYTSGTTGEPKGAVLTHYNIICNTVSGIKLFNINCNDIIMSYLPLSHMFERTCGYYIIIFAGGSIWYAENFSTIVQDVKKIKPTLIIALPRVLEKAYQTAVDKITHSSGITRKMVQSALRNLNKYANLKRRKLSIPLYLKIKCVIYDRLVARKFRKIAGGNLRLVVSGGAPLNKKIGIIYYTFGFNICEGYGLTETSPVISATIPQDSKIGTVGKPFPDIQVKIGDNSEILTKGPNLMLGYYNKPEETAKAIDRDGWFHTGDQGKFDDRGNLVITGRIKELIVTSYGKKIPPNPIEEKLAKGEYIEQAIIYGDNHSYIIGLIIPKKNMLENYAKNNKITYQNYDELLKNDLIYSLIKTNVDYACKDLAPYEKVKDFVLLSEGFTIDNGLLTPTLKLRRNKVFEKYRNLIKAVYEKSDNK